MTNCKPTANQLDRRGDLLNDARNLLIDVVGKLPYSDRKGVFALIDEPGAEVGV